MQRVSILWLMALLLVACQPGMGGSAVVSPTAASAQGPSTGATLRTVADILLPGDTSRFDYESFDPLSHRLYIAHLGAGEVIVYDTQTRSVVEVVRGVPDVHGVIAVPEIGRVYATAANTNQVVVINPDSLSVLGTVPGGDYPDGLAYDPENGKLYVSDERGGTDTVIDAQSNQPVATISLGGDVGNTQYDPSGHRILVAIGASNQLAVIDPTKDVVAGKYDTTGCEGPHGVAIDDGGRRAFIACQGNAKLVVMDLEGMKIVSTHDVGTDPDVLAFDPGLRRLYVAAESGPLTVFAEEGGSVREIARGDVGPNAHSVAVDPATHHIYVPLADVGGRPVLREIEVVTPGSE